MSDLRLYMQAVRAWWSQPVHAELIYRVFDRWFMILTSKWTLAWLGCMSNQSSWAFFFLCPSLAASWGTQSDARQLNVAEHRYVSLLSFKHFALFQRLLSCRCHPCHMYCCCFIINLLLLLTGAYTW